MSFISFACASYPDEPRSPEAGEDTYIINEDEFLTVTEEDGILSNDRPQEGEKNDLIEINGQMLSELTEVTLQDPVEGEQQQIIIDLKSGKLIMTELDGSFTYEPNPNHYGTEQVAYRIRNDKGKEGDGKFTLEVKPVNDPPEAGEDHFNIDSTGQQRLDVLANDRDVEDDQIRIVGVGPISFGSAEIAPDGSAVLFTPDPNNSGPLIFNYTIADEANEEAEGTVHLNNGDNQLQPDTITVEEDSTGTWSYQTLLANDGVDPGVEIDFGQPENGEVNHDPANRTFTYTPNPDFFGTDYFIYTVEVGGGSVSGRVTVIVTPAMDAPVISDIPDQIVQVGRTVGPLPFTVGNVDSSQTETEVLPPTWEAVPSGLIPPNGIIITGVGQNRAVWITPTPNTVGTPI